MRCNPRSSPQKKGRTRRRKTQMHLAGNGLDSLTHPWNSQQSVTPGPGICSAASSLLGERGTHPGAERETLSPERNLSSLPRTDESPDLTSEKASFGHQSVDTRASRSHFWSHV